MITIEAATNVSGKDVVGKDVSGKDVGECGRERCKRGKCGRGKCEIIAVKRMSGFGIILTYARTYRLFR